MLTVEQTARMEKLVKAINRGIISPEEAREAMRQEGFPMNIVDAWYFEFVAPAIDF